MTITVKLDAVFEEQLRQRAAALGMSTSEVVRAALVDYLAQAQAAQPASAFALGQGLFGRFGAEPELAADRKRALGEAWAERHRVRGA